MSASMELEGLEKVTRELNSRLKKIKTVSAKGLADVCLDCLGRSVERAPVDLGDLRGSGYAKLNGRTIAKGSPDGGVSSMGSASASGVEKLEGVIGFEEPYALKQHEDLTLNHPKGGEAKYLEKTLDENMEKYINYLAGEVKNSIR
jgi:hypothetical protein